MDCCDSSEGDARDCPRCGERGKAVGAVTLDALLVEPTRRVAGPWRFCRNAACPAVYFHDSAAVLGAEDVRVRVGQMEERPDRPICYCFGHSAVDLLERPSLRDDIAAACKRGEDRCPETNPQGSCCLGNVAAVLRDAWDGQGVR